MTQQRVRQLEEAAVTAAVTRSGGNGNTRRKQQRRTSDRKNWWHHDTSKSDFDITESSIKGPSIGRSSSDGRSVKKRR